MSRKLFALIVALAIIVFSLMNLEDISASLNARSHAIDEIVMLKSPSNSTYNPIIEKAVNLILPTSVAIAVSTVFIIGLSLGVASGRLWEKGLMFVLGVDAVLKLVNLISQLIVGRNLGYMMPTIVLIGLDLVFLLNIFWLRQMRHELRDGVSSRPIRLWAQPTPRLQPDEGL